MSRTVLLVGPWAVKVPRFAPLSRRGALWSLAEGVLANLSEAEWSGVPGVCPVHWSLLGLLNVYPRCEPAPDGPIAYAEIAEPWIPVDPRRENVGMLHGELVWLDYGSR